MKKNRILFISSSLENKGPVNVLFNIVKYMDRDHFEITVLSLMFSNNHHRLSDFEHIGVNVLNFNATNTISAYWKLFFYLKFNNFDVIHAHCLRSLLLVFLLKRKFFLFYTIHIFPGFQTLCMKGKLKGVIFNLLSKYLLNKTDVNIACGESLKSEIDFFLKKPCIAIPNGVDFIHISQYLSVYEQKEKLSLNPALNYFISIGRLSPEKNILFLVENFESSVPKNYGLIILGDGVLYDEILDYQSDRIFVLGFKNNINDYLRISNFYISSSIVEGLPNTALEAISFGLPLLVSNIPSHREVVDKASASIGLTFNIDDVNDFNEKISLLLKEDYPTLKNNAVKCFSEHFTAKKMSEKYQRLYDDKLK